MKRNGIYVMLVMIMCMTASAAFAQTYAYRLIKMVSKYGEVREMEKQEKKSLKIWDSHQMKSRKFKN